MLELGKKFPFEFIPEFLLLHRTKIRCVGHSCNGHCDVTSLERLGRKYGEDETYFRKQKLRENQLSFRGKGPEDLLSCVPEWGIWGPSSWKQVEEFLLRENINFLTCSTSKKNSGAPGPVRILGPSDIADNLLPDANPKKITKISGCVGEKFNQNLWEKMGISREREKNTVG